MRRPLDPHRELLWRAPPSFPASGARLRWVRRTVPQSSIYNGHVDLKELACGCRVETSRDFLGRVIGTIVEKGPACPKPDHEPARVVVMPGRENARSDT